LELCALHPYDVTFVIFTDVFPSSFLTLSTPADSARSRHSEEFEESLIVGPRGEIPRFPRNDGGQVATML
jgi:hypothetical protein